MKKITVYKIRAQYTITPAHIELFTREGLLDDLTDADEEGVREYKYAGCEVTGSTLLRLLPEVEVVSKRSFMFDESEMEDVDE